MLYNLVRDTTYVGRATIEKLSLESFFEVRLKPIEKQV